MTSSRLTTRVPGVHSEGCLSGYLGQKQMAPDTRDLQAEGVTIKVKSARFSLTVQEFASCNGHVQQSNSCLISPITTISFNLNIESVNLQFR